MTVVVLRRLSLVAVISCLQCCQGFLKSLECRPSSRTALLLSHSGNSNITEALDQKKVSLLQLQADRLRQEAQQLREQIESDKLAKQRKEQD